MKKIGGFSLFWKVYLTMLFAIFLPVMLFTLTNFVQDLNGTEPHGAGMIQSLTWTASELAEQSESISDGQIMPWIARVKEASGLDLCVERDGKSFYSPGSDWLASHESAMGSRGPGRTVIASAVSGAGRVKITAAMFPFKERKIDGVIPRIPIHLLVTVFLCVIFSFLLVRNFMTPLSELRFITGKLAGGDLSVRVGPGVTGRSDEIADLGRSFNSMAERVENLVFSQQRLLSDISHEIRSPLQRMAVACALLRRKSGDEDCKFEDRIELEIGRIDNMVEELLVLTRNEGMNTIQSETVELGGIIESIVKDAEFERGIAAEKITSNTRELSVVGDPLLLNRALGNVILNAVRYTAPETGVEIDAYREEGRVAVAVRDHGQGVPEEELDKIFLPYYRTDKARERSQGGLGLGLAITKRIIENCGGEITAANSPTGGLVVTIYLNSRPPAV
jgi:two-component system sensor histidine kinase CpxA